MVLACRNEANPSSGFSLVIDEGMAMGPPLLVIIISFGREFLPCEIRLDFEVSKTEEFHDVISKCVSIAVTDEI